jgi:hypothetical protein
MRELQRRLQLGLGALGAVVEAAPAHASQHLESYQELCLPLMSSWLVGEAPGWGRWGGAGAGEEWLGGRAGRTGERALQAVCGKLCREDGVWGSSAPPPAAPYGLRR